MKAAHSNRHSTIIALASIWMSLAALHRSSLASGIELCKCNSGRMTAHLHTAGLGLLRQVVHDLVGGLLADVLGHSEAPPEARPKVRKRISACSSRKNSRSRC